MSNKTFGLEVTVTPVYSAAQIQTQINNVQAAGGGKVVFTTGTYFLASTLNVTGDFVRLVGESRGTQLKATNHNQTIVHFSASHGGVEDMRFHNNTYSNVTALRVSPQNETQTTTVVHQNYNRFDNLLIEGCANGILMRTGPRVNGVDSGCWYNVFDTIMMTYTARGIYLQNSHHATSSPVNRNQFYSVRIGQWVNTGVEIESGDTNTFVGCSFEGIIAANAGPWPHATASAIRVHAAGSNGADNNHNKFFGIMIEQCDTHLINHNNYSEFYGSSIDFNGTKFQGVLPLYAFGGSNPSYTPVIFPGLVYPEGNLPGYANKWNLSKYP